ncbi:PKD domain-containing protein [Pseudomonadota bacterium]
MKGNRFKPVKALTGILVCLVSFTLVTHVLAKPDKEKLVTYGVGKPDSILELPPGRLKQQLNALGANSRARALRKLQQLSFPKEDLEYLRVDRDGAIWYADSFLPDPQSAPQQKAPIVSQAIAESQIFNLHSLPGSSNVLYLDFDGHIITGTAWNNETGIDPYVALPFDPSVDDLIPTEAIFSSDELNRIGEIWARIAEDFAPFDIDITTELPSSFDDFTGRVVFTHDIDANGEDMPSVNAGGVAYVDVFGETGVYNYAYYSPAFVYYTNLYTNLHGYPTLNAEAGTHEFGHNIAMGHDGAPGTSYYSGHGTPFVDWGPIMGGSYSDNVTQWSQGEYAGATNFEDDLALIAANLGYLGDDHGDGFSTATPVVIESSGAILVSDPEVDPHNVMPENKGVIGDRDDVDWYKLDVGAGGFNIKVTPAWKAFTRSSHRGANLDVELKLYDSTIAEIASHEPTDDTYGEITTTVNTGRYYISVDGVGNNTNSDYSDYNSMGMYFIEGTVVVPPADTTPPTPGTMTWAVTPNALSSSSITMTASTATDAIGTVEYEFVCVSGGAGCEPSVWQPWPTFMATGLDYSTEYTYKVRAADNLGNATAYSVQESATTQQAPPVATFSVNCDRVLCSFTDTSTDVDGTVKSWTWDFGDGSNTNIRHPIHVYPADNTYTVTLTVEDNVGATGQASSQLSVSKTPATIVQDFQISQGSDDIETRNSDGAYLLNSSDLELGEDVGYLGPQRVGLRFNNVNLPQGMNIGTSYLHFRADEDWGLDTPTSVQIQAEDVDNALPFSSNYNLASRATTSEVVAWNNIQAWTKLHYYNSPSLTGIVQELVDRPGWVANNSMVYVIAGTGTRTADSYEGGYAPKLHVEYTESVPVCVANRTIEANLWESVSLPCDPGTANKVEDVFSNLVSAGKVYDVDWFIWRYDAATNTYFKMAPDDVMYPGQGYWIYTLTATTLDYTGVVNQTGDLAMTANANDGQFNYMGHTLNSNKPWIDFKAAYSDTVATIPDADDWTDANPAETECAQSPPTDLCLVSRTAYVWKDGNWQTFDAHVPGMNDDIESSYGVFVLAYRPGAMLRIEDAATAGGPSAQASPVTTSSAGIAKSGSQIQKIGAGATDMGSEGKKDQDETEDGSWHIRLLANSENFQDRSNILGQQANSRDGKDSNDIEELAPFGGRYLSLLFENDAFPDADWGYTSDIRTLNKKPSGEWPFVIRASADVEEITISWEGDSKLLKNATLIDKQSGENLKLKGIQSYRFPNSGGENHFTFIIK